MQVASLSPKGPLVNPRSKSVLLIFAAMVIFLSSVAYPTLSVLVNNYRDQGKLAAAVFMTAQEYGYGVYGEEVSYLESLLTVPGRLIASQESPTLVVDVKFKHMVKLQEKRAGAIAQGVLVQSEDDFVPATIRFQDTTKQAKIRLKGDWVDHLKGPKYSLRVHMKGDDRMFGIRRFSLQDPVARGYHAEALYLNSLREYDLIAPRYFFVNLILNGQNMGLMAFEEHFSKELLERAGQRESVVVKFDESLVWEYDFDAMRGFQGPYDDFRNARIDAFQMSRIDSSAVLSANYQTAVGMLRGFTQNALKASETFDAERTGRFMAVADFWGAWHSIEWINMRFYFNPITLKLEPIGYDAELQIRRRTGRATTSSTLTRAILRDPEVFKAYKETVSDLSKQIENGSLVARIEELQDSLLSQLHREYPLLEGIDRGEVAGKGTDILGDPESLSVDDYIANPPDIQVLKTSPISLPRLVHAYVVRNHGGKSFLELINAVPHTVQVVSVSSAGAGRAATSPVSNRVELPIFLPARPKGRISHLTRIALGDDPAMIDFKIEVRTKIPDTDREYSQIATAYPPVLSAPPLPVSANLSGPFLESGRPGASFHVRKGSFNIDAPVILPTGASLTVDPGVTLRFGEDAFLLVRGPSFLNGTTESPIVLEAWKDSTTWQGLVVMEAEEPSDWTNVVIRNTSGISQPKWQLTGGVTLYSSDINMRACSIESTKAEDALNIIRSVFDIQDLEISETASDGFDGDFTSGTMVSSVFRNIGRVSGGDAFDLSGSQVTMRNTAFTGVNDKALSIGEKSTLSADGVTVVDVGTGAASKDASTVTLTNSTIQNARVAGLLAYQKKPEFGPAQLTAIDVEIDQANVVAKAQTGSRLTLNGDDIPTEDLDVDVLYETVMKRGARP